MTFTFTSKETYLAYRKEWAQRYLAAIKLVRTSRHGIREANRQYSKGNGYVSDIWPFCYALTAARKEVVNLLDELYKARQEAGRQMRARST